MNGYYNVLKPSGMSSAAVVAVFRRLTGEKRVGHAGTLDPEAAGILPIMIGKAARLFDYLTDKEKEYVAVAAFGFSTDSQDATGAVLERGENYPDLERVREKCGSLVGEIRQRPSMYSAIKVGGKPLYERARRGEVIEVPERTVHIDRIDVLREMPDHGVEIRVLCGRGTYIRTLCDDLGKLCGCPAHMRSLLRTRSGVFGLDTAITLEDARSLAERGSLISRMLPPDYPLAHLPRADAQDKLSRKIAAGARLPIRDVRGDLPEAGKPIRLYLRDEFWGIVEQQGEELVWRAQIAPETEESK